MGAMSIKPVPSNAPESIMRSVDPSLRGGAESLDGEMPTIPATMIFEDGSRTPVPIRDPNTASLIFKPLGQGCFP
jgi:hypothetical protein